ncbi:MAG: CehA/McbA family metallohydrolase [Actinomycetia bacterium]|nr:CehA/McbA family metallohydrolase [Actinomycetes bacterium]
MTEVWSKADLHIHSNHSDGLAKIPEIMEYASTKTDLSVIAITDHNTIEGALFAQSLEEMYGIGVVVGEEVSSKSGHIIGLWLTEAIPPNLSVAETVSRINEQGGIAVIAHPFANRAFGPFGLQSVGQAIHDVAFHALEVYNSSPYLIHANRLAAKAFAGGQGIAATGGSDAHVLKAVGNGYTLFRGTSADDLRTSIENLETRAEAGRGGLSIALRYAFRYPQIRRLQSWNWERCKATK